MPMIAITTNNSTSVKPVERFSMPCGLPDLRYMIDCLLRPNVFVDFASQYRGHGKRGAYRRFAKNSVKAALRPHEESLRMACIVGHALRLTDSVSTL
jgi:hypothetical protein